MAGHLMSSGEVDVVVVGADRIAANGDIANKIGTYSRRRAREAPPHPVLRGRAALAPSIRIPTARASRSRNGRGARSPSCGRRGAPEGVAVLNPAFDVTPAELITGIITERGIVRKPNRARVASLLSRSRARAGADRRARR